MIAGVTSQIRDKSNEVNKKKTKIKTGGKSFGGVFSFFSLFVCLIHYFMEIWNKDGGSVVSFCFFLFFSPSDPTSIFLFSLCSEQEEMADGTAAAAIHCVGVSREFIFSLVCGGRRGTGCLGL